MNRNFYYGFFKYLYDIYDISEWTSIVNYVLPHIRDSQKLADTIHIKAMLDDLEEKKIIEWKADKPTTDENGVTSTHWKDIARYKRDLGKDNNHTFDNTTVEVKLTRLKGIDYAANLVNNQTIRDSTLSTNCWMKWLTIILASSAVLTLIVQGWQCDISRKQLDLQKEEAKKQSILYPTHEIPENANAYDLYRQEKTVVGHNKESVSVPLSDTAKTLLNDTAALRHNPINKSTKPK